MRSSKHEREDKEEDFCAVFTSILMRINEHRKEKDKIIVFDRERARACKDYVKCFPDDVVLFDAAFRGILERRRVYEA